MVWGAIRYHSRPCLIRIADNFTSQQYITEMLEPYPHVPYTSRKVLNHNILQFLDSDHVPLLCCIVFSPSMPPIEHVWDVVERQLVHQRPTAATTDELWACIEAAWHGIPQTHIQCLFLSVPDRVEGVICLWRIYQIPIIVYSASQTKICFMYVMYHKQSAS